MHLSASSSKQQINNECKSKLEKTKKKRIAAAEKYIESTTA
jgi:hypothetical protein